MIRMLSYLKLGAGSLRTSALKGPELLEDAQSIFGSVASAATSSIAPCLLQRGSNADPFLDVSTHYVNNFWVLINAARRGSGKTSSRMFWTGAESMI